MTRILHVHAGQAWGGVETALLTLARAGGMEHQFALGWDATCAARLREAAPVRILGQARRRLPWTVWRSRRRLAEVIRDAAPDVCMMHSTWAATIWGPVAVRARLPLVLWHHGRPGPTRVTVTRHLANSTWTAEHVRHRFPGAPVDVLHPPADPREPAQPRHIVRSRLGTSETAIVFLLAARWEPGKGQDVLVEALATLPRDTPWAAWLAGSATGPAEERFQAGVSQRARHLGLEGHVKLLGARDDVPDLLGAADVYVQPNTAPEAFGLSFVEAMAAGLPVVTSDLGAAREVVGPAGRLVPPGDAGALAAALGELCDAATRAPLGAAGPQRARTLSDPPAVATRLAALLPAAAGTTLPHRDR